MNWKVIERLTWTFRLRPPVAAQIPNEITAPMMHKPKAMTRICLLLKFQHISRGRLTLDLCGCSWRACCSCSCRCSCRRSMISSNESNIESWLVTDTDRSPGTCTVALPTADWVPKVRYTDQWTGPSFASTDEQWTRKKHVWIQPVVIPSAR